LHFLHRRSVGSGPAKRRDSIRNIEIAASGEQFGVTSAVQGDAVAKTGQAEILRQQVSAKR